MSAIAAYDDLHAWLLRGFVGAGLPDRTLGGGGLPAGAVSAENLRLNRGTDGVLLAFTGVDPGEEWVYAVQVVQEPTGEQVAVTCADTLFRHVYPAAPVDGVPARILQDVRAHNDAFARWRRQGGAVGYAERLSIVAERGAPCSPGLQAFLEGMYRAGRDLGEGPAAAWWVVSHGRASVGALVTTGAGAEPVYRTGPEVPASQRPEYQPYVRRLRTAGTVAIVTGATSLLAALFALAFVGVNLFRYRADVVLAFENGAWPLAFFVTSCAFAGAQVLTGMRLRSLRSRGLVRALAVIGMLPCLGPCFLVGIPVGAWVLVLTNDKRAPYVFGR